jgi:hypothetical protein
MIKYFELGAVPVRPRRADPWTRENRMALMPQFAPIVVLLFLGSVLAGLALLAIPAGYATLLFGASLTSQERVLSLGAKKCFCEPRL